MTACAAPPHRENADDGGGPTGENAMNRPREEHIRHLQNILGPEGWLAADEDKAPYLQEWRDKFHGETPLVMRPASTAEVAQILAYCNEQRLAVVPQGGNTGLCGGAMPKDGELLLSLGRMKRIRDIDTDNFTITVEAGCILADIHRAAAERQRLFPLHIGAEGSCQIGGNLSTNAGGTAVLRYGNMRELTLGLEVVLANGEIWDGLRGLRKDNTGYDLKQLFIGAEGTLGVITAAVLKLFPLPRRRAVALAGLKTCEQAVELLSRSKERAGDRLTGFELMNKLSLELVGRHLPECATPVPLSQPWYVLIELSDTDEAPLDEKLQHILEGAWEADLIEDAHVASSLTQADRLWRMRHAISEAQKHEGGSIKHDISVPVSQVAAFIARADHAVAAMIPGFRSIAFGHVGDGNIHYNPLQPRNMAKTEFLDRWAEVAETVHDIAASLGGSISAEHGLGQLKNRDLPRYKSAVEIAMMRKLKAALDPHGILNPGKVLP